MAQIELLVPDIGDFKDVAVIELLVKPGDRVQVDQSLMTVESDKASMEIPSSHAGIIKALKVALGSQVNHGSLVAVLETDGDVPAPAPAPAPVEPAHQALTQPIKAAAMPTARLDTDQGLGTGLPHASPSVRKLAREYGVPLAEVKGSGPKGRITAQDLQNFSRSVMRGELRTQAQALRPGAGVASASGGLDLLPWPKVDFSKFGPIEMQPLSRIKKIAAQNLTRNWVMIPAVTYHDDADITELEAFRVQLNKENEKSGLKLTMLAFIIKASVKALQKFPEFNASLDGDHLVLKKYFHIAFAADTPSGLVVPVIKNADQKSVYDIAQESGALAKKGREGKLSPAEMQGACFTISSLGGIGGNSFSPIINAPEVAILGVSKNVLKPVWDGNQFIPRLTMPLSLSADHRVIDGAAATRFTTYLAQLLADFKRVSL